MMLSDAQSWLVAVPCLAGPAEPTSALAVGWVFLTELMP